MHETLPGEPSEETFDWLGKRAEAGCGPARSAVDTSKYWIESAGTLSDECRACGASLVNPRCLNLLNLLAEEQRAFWDRWYDDRQREVYEEELLDEKMARLEETATGDGF